MLAKVVRRAEAAAGGNQIDRQVGGLHEPLRAPDPLLQ
jgi:hypothetical protein